MSADDGDLDALLGSVAGGEAVDWERARARARGEAARTRVDSLRELARVADFHRALQREIAHGADAASAGVARWGDLLLLERIGAGASGDVYRGWDPALQREVAVKLVRAPEAGWLEEARALARVRDPHVVAVHGAREVDGRAGLWMEFLRGPTLEQEMARRGALPADEVRALGLALARALAAAHGAGALHRDLKPGNVVLEPRGRAVLADFGVGRRAGPGADAKSASGTPLFMSPERLAGAPAVPRDDLYALGVTLWWALAGRPPFDATDLDGLRAAALRGPVPALRALRPDAPRDLARAIERAMAPRAEDRFAGADALAAALASVAPARAARRLRIAAWTAAAVVAVLATAWAWQALRAPRAATGRAPAPASGAAPVPSVPGPTPPPAAALAPYDVSADFARVGAQGAVPLADGDRVRPGDALTLALHASRPVWAYVLDADERGECYLLFPQPEFDRANPLPANAGVTLPGPRHGRASAWTVTSAGVREHLLVVTSPAPLPELEAELAHLPAPEPGRAVRYARVGPRSLEALRGIGGVSDEPAAAVGVPGVAASAAGAGALFERVRALAGAERGVRGTWMRQITLENPAPPGPARTP